MVFLKRELLCLFLTSLLCLPCIIALAPSSPNVMPSHAKRMASHKIRDAEFNSTLSVGEIHKYALYPVKSGKVVIDSVRDKLARYIKSGTYRPIPSRHRPEYDGVLVWKVTTNEKEAEALQRSLGSDVKLYRRLNI